MVAGLLRDIGSDLVDAGHRGRGGRKHQPGSRVYAAELSAAEISTLIYVTRKAPELRARPGDITGHGRQRPTLLHAKWPHPDE
ncbi:hypothetical protein FHS42_002551 [Streptomyces zagrosensis]|uniref:Uncharacterized protein n=1 Tax=Streptomyces zagrosensis TaxID=1042984 RepID=A0A7W9UZ75_9ACTN|nr:hypothetical protein [Streptomyces zagrosensis]